MGKELKNLLNNYLALETPTILSCCSESEILLRLVSFIHQLNQYESPDMYSKIDNNVLILEHFGFDGSKDRKRKGMEGYEKESLVENNYSQFENDNTRNEFIEPIDYSQKTTYYYENFKNTYQAHYKKIENYKNNLRDDHIIDDQSTVLTGFFIENKYPPYIIGTRGIEELDLLFCKQFLDIFELSNNLDFVLFGGIFKQRHRLSFIDKSMIKSYREKEINLDNLNLLHVTEISWGYKENSIDD